MDSVTHPSFLDELDSDPDQAFADFYRLATSLLTQRPPRVLRAVPDDDRQDLIHDIIFKLARDNFQLLRLYEDRGRPFQSWLYAIACNTCIDHIRKNHIRPEAARVSGYPDDFDPLDLVSSPRPGPDQQLEHDDALKLVRNALEGLGRRCQLLLQMAADGFTPRQMTVSLRLGPDQNKKISDDLRYCRKILVDKLARDGFDPQKLS